MGNEGKNRIGKTMTGLLMTNKKDKRAGADERLGI